MRRTLFLLPLFLLSNLVIFAQNEASKWATNFGLELGGDFGLGAAGLSNLQAANDPLVTTNLKQQYALEAGFYVEWLKLRERSDKMWGKKMPGFGIRTGANWTFFRADNSSEGGGQSIGLNYANLPLLFEICLGYHQGVTNPSVTPGSTTYTGRQNTDGSVTVTGTSTPAIYHRGGNPTSSATFLYAGPQISYLFKSFNYSGDPIKDPLLEKNYLSFVAGIAFWLHSISFDLSYQKGLTSVYQGKDLTVDGFALKLGICFSSRLYNK